jgi:hypothetical protein
MVLAVKVTIIFSGIQIIIIVSPFKYPLHFVFSYMAVFIQTFNLS